MHYVNNIYFLILLIFFCKCQHKLQFSLCTSSTVVVLTHIYHTLALQRTVKALQRTTRNQKGPPSYHKKARECKGTIRKGSDVLFVCQVVNKCQGLNVQKLTTNYSSKTYTTSDHEGKALSACSSYNYKARDLQSRSALLRTSTDHRNDVHLDLKVCHFTP